MEVLSVRNTDVEGACIMLQPSSSDLIAQFIFITCALLPLLSGRLPSGLHKLRVLSVGDTHLDGEPRPSFHLFLSVNSALADSELLPEGIAIAREVASLRDDEYTVYVDGPYDHEFRDGTVDLAQREKEYRKYFRGKETRSSIASSLC
jgi:hypothetical protein